MRPCVLLRDQLADAVFRHVARLGHARHLEQRASGEISGSSPLPDVVTRSTGTAADGFSAFSFSTSSLIRSASALLVGPRLEPPELAAL